MVGKLKSGFDGVIRATVMLATVLTLNLAAGCSRQDPPNVLFIVLDTLRADHLGCYGYSRNTSPRIDAFAEKATLYRTVMAASPWTVPTHASLFTGLYPFEHGAHTYKDDVRDPLRATTRPIHGRDLVYPLHESHLTLAEVFRNEGYETGAVVANAGYLNPRFQMNQGFDAYWVKRAWAPEINKLAFEWLDQHVQPQQDSRKPFFMFVNYIDTHRIYNTTPRPGFLEKPAVQDKGELVDALIDQVMPGKGPVPEDLVSQITDQYDTAVANVDEAIGALLDKLVAMGVYDETMIVLTSDHGEYFGEHMLVEHSKDVYQPALWAPLIIKAPGQKTAGVVNTLTSSTDVPNLVLSQTPPEPFEKYLHLFPDAPGNHLVISENYYTRAKDLYDDRWGHRFDRVRTAVYDWPYKYIDSSDGKHELYNLQEDPAELNNLLTKETQIAARLADRLKEFQSKRRASGRFGKLSGSPVEPDEKLLEELRSLGYIK